MHEMLLDMEFAGLCEIIQRKNRGKFLSNMAISILEGTAHNCVILILGQDRFRELKIGMELDENSCERGMKTYNDAINVILDKGLEFGVHTVVQLDKFSDLLYEDKFSPKSICRKFKHLILLHTDEDINALLSLNDDIPLNELNNSQDCLTAFYYDDEDYHYTLISPYMPLSSKETINLIKEK